MVSRETQEQAERLMAESLRTLSQLCLKVADLVESQRLERQGFERPGAFLKRLDRPSAGAPSAAAAAHEGPAPRTPGTSR